MARRILGLDLGSYVIKAVEMRQSLRDLEVVQLRSLPLDDPSPSLPSEIREFLQLTSFFCQPVDLGVCLIFHVRLFFPSCMAD